MVVSSPWSTKLNSIVRGILIILILRFFKTN
jgi:hypothetical protein